MLRVMQKLVLQFCIAFDNIRFPARVFGSQK